MANYTVYRGDTFSLSLSFTLDAVAYDLTGATARFTIKSSYTALLDTTALVQKSTGSGITNVSAPAGTGPSCPGPYGSYGQCVYAWLI